MHVQSRVQAAHPPAGAGPQRTVNRHMALAQAECIQHGLRTLAFCKTRKLCELVTAYTRETLRVTAPHLTQSIAVYRAGYSPAVRLSVLPWLHTLLGLLAGPSEPCLVSHGGCGVLGGDLTVCFRMSLCRSAAGARVSQRPY